MPYLWQLQHVACVCVSWAVACPVQLCTVRVICFRGMAFALPVVCVAFDSVCVCVCVKEKWVSSMCQGVLVHCVCSMFSTVRLLP